MLLWVCCCANYCLCLDEENIHNGRHSVFARGVYLLEKQPLCSVNVKIIREIILTKVTLKDDVPVKGSSAKLDEGTGCRLLMLFTSLCFIIML